MIEDSFTVVVETEAAPAGEPRVRHFRLGARTVEVIETLDRWPGADHLYVKLCGADGATYILRQDMRDGWRLVLFRDRRAAEPGG